MLSNSFKKIKATDLEWTEVGEIYTPTKKRRFNILNLIRFIKNERPNLWNTAKEELDVTLYAIINVAIPKQMLEDLYKNYGEHTINRLRDVRTVKNYLYDVLLGRVGEAIIYAYGLSMGYTVQFNTDASVWTSINSDSDLMLGKNKLEVQLTYLDLESDKTLNIKPSKQKEAQRQLEKGNNYYIYSLRFVDNKLYYYRFKVTGNLEKFPLVDGNSYNGNKTKIYKIPLKYCLKTEI